jgi:hypothetical protein
MKALIADLQAKPVPKDAKDLPPVSPENLN